LSKIIACLKVSFMREKHKARWVPDLQARGRREWHVMSYKKS
jgi:hypothetical protein